MTEHERAVVESFRARRPDLWADVSDADLLRHARAAWDDLKRVAYEVFGWIVPYARDLERWRRQDHPETIKASATGAAARHKRRYQRMMARKGV